ncbi:MAG: hypothetical protein ACUVRJ_06635 [Candidatus Villigracilaceae bacterium]
MNWNGRQLLSWPVIAGAFGVAVVLMILSLLGTGLTGSKQTAAPDLAMAEITIIPAPTATPMVQALPPEISLAGTPTVPANEIVLGSYVQITGTDGDGLRLRSAAGLNAEPLFLGYDEEVFVVRDGPQQADNYIWWYLVAPYDETRAGWAAANFLTLISAPNGE